MSKTVSTLIKEVLSLAESMESMNLGDQEAWRRIIQQLQDMAVSLPKKRQDVRPLFELCRQALESALGGTGSQSLKIVAAVTDALYAADGFLADGQERKAALAQATRMVADAVESAQTTHAAVSETDASPAVSSAAGLNEAAAWLVQLEAADTDGLIRLKHHLQQAVTGDTLPETSRSLIDEALAKIDALLAADADDIEDLWQQIGDAIEAALDHLDDPAPNAPNMDGTSADQPESAPAAEQPAEGGHDALHRSDAQNPAAIRAAADHTVSTHDGKDYMPQDADADLLGEFIAEGNDLIAAAEEALLSLEVDPADMEAVGKVFRAFHTVKGTSAFMELNLISDLGHHAESLLSRVRDQEIRYAGGYADLSLRALDMIKDLIGSVQAALSGSPLLKPEGYDELIKLLADPEAHGINDEIDDVTSPRIGDMLVAQGKVDRNQVETVIDTHPGEPLGSAMVKTGTATVTEVGHALRAQKRIQTSQQVMDSSVRVSTQRLDRLIDMVGELVIAHSMVAQDESAMNNANYELQKKISHTSKIVRELQDISMSLRMVPLKATFNKMARLVRDVSRKIGKTVNFVTEGEDTEIDRNLVDVINDPLVHMVRNAVDHGIETPEEREKAGKPRQGDVQLSAYHSAGSVVVEIRDDGKGLDRNALVVKARERGLIDGDAEQLSDREVYNLIFEPGFSTAQTVTDVSGRGVGMDVVKRNIESLRGQVEIRSELGKGSVFRMSLPLTLAIIDGMAVRVGPETYVIPTVSIISTLKPKPEDLSTILKQGEILSMQGQLVPLFRIASLYQIDSRSMREAEPLIVVVEDEDRQAGLIIDELIGRQQVVIKSLGETMRNIPGISGGAILPNGRVGLILDVGDLLKFANRAFEKDCSDTGEANRYARVTA